MRAAWLLLSLLALCGCVRRALVVETDPPGAEVWVDGEPAGLTPLRLSFTHYGKRQITLAKGGYAVLRAERDIAAPWYQRFPIDFAAENLWPGELVDERFLLFALVPERSDPEGVLARGKEMRTAAGAANP